MNLKKYFFKKKILITGHTGFKGSWLLAWLQSIGADVTGIALEPPTNPSHFKYLNLSNRIENIMLDIRNEDLVAKELKRIKPDYVFHLAAQAIVTTSYQDPVKTWTTNLNGTINILNGLLKLKKKCYVVLVTSDKCYDNVEWVWGYRENDKLGGEDPYSASKGATEIAIRSYVKSFFPKKTSLVRIGSARAGNVIGGGDWAKNRLIPDCMNAWSKGKVVNLRNPNSTRPWQHVLEPLSGYLTQAMALVDNPDLHGEAFNFGPNTNQENSVIELVSKMSKFWNKVRWKDISSKKKGPYESGLLKLNCDKALNKIRWHGNLNFQDTLKMTVEWYQSYYENPSGVNKKTYDQIKFFTNKAKQNGLKWAQ